MTIEPRLFRSVMRNFATGVTVVTTRSSYGDIGITVNSLTSVSLEPTLVLICIDRGAFSHPWLLESGVFAVNILSEHQEDCARLFASRAAGADPKLAGVPFRRGRTGAPIFERALAYLDCRVVATYPGGDHTIFLGEVEDAAVLDESVGALLYFRGDYARLADPADGR